MSAADPGRDPPVLDWSDRSHWSHTPGRCRYCDKPTNLLDSKRKFAHKVCAEAALHQQAIEAADAYHQEGHLG